jgi:hypothetical protein
MKEILNKLDQAETYISHKDIREWKEGEKLFRKGLIMAMKISDGENLSQTWSTRYMMDGIKILASVNYDLTKDIVGNDYLFNRSLKG